MEGLPLGLTASLEPLACVVQQHYRLLLFPPGAGVDFLSLQQLAEEQHSSISGQDTATFDPRAQHSPAKSNTWLMLRVHCLREPLTSSARETDAEGD